MSLQAEMQRGGSEQYRSMIEIRSKNNERLKALLELARSRKERERRGCVLVDGGKLCIDAVETGHELLELWITDTASSRDPALFKRLFAVADETFLLQDFAAEKISDLKAPQGIWGVFQLPDHAVLENLGKGRRILGICEVQNPENVGAMIRTASALGYDGILVSADSADLWSPRVIRAGALAQFNIPVCITDDFVSAVKQMNAAGFVSCASALDKTACSVSEVRKDGKILLLVGNEGHGIQKELLDVCTERVYLPMSHGVDSLNANAAAAILMWELREK